MKGTRHNGRSGKDGVYNPLHNDRRFDPEHSEHIDNERVRQNIYWDCYQGYTTMADRGKEDNFSFNQIEMAYYVDGRMLEIYLLTSLAPIPVATLSNRELGSTGQNYIKSLFAVGFQGLLILVCVAIYAVLIQGIATSGDPIGAIWGTVGYTVLLCFMLFKTGSIAQRLFGAH